MTCPHSEIEAALDRWLECHWFIHQMESHYHVPEAFRFSLNAFIRAAKEIPQLLKMQLQNRPAYASELKPMIDELGRNQLFHKLSKNRDFIVHQGMLKVSSSGAVGTTEGKGFKMGIKFNVPSHEPSDEAYERYLSHCKANAKFRGAFGPDCDSRPCVYREWKISAFGETEILEVAISAWKLVGELLSQLVQRFGGEPLDLELPCLHEASRVRMKLYSQSEFFRIVDGPIVA